jgi:hypothetical protein
VSLQDSLLVVSTERRIFTTMLRQMTYQYSATPWLVALVAVELSGTVTCLTGSPTEIVSTPSACTASDVTTASADRTFGVGHIVMVKRDAVGLARYAKFEAFVGVQRSGTLLMRSCTTLRGNLKPHQHGRSSLVMF